MDASRTTYELKDDLARSCPASVRRDPNQKLAWVNSICILFLIIGIVGVNATPYGERLGFFGSLSLVF